MSDAVEQEPERRWTKYGHRFESGRTKDGYAVCIACGVHENEDGICEPCPDSVLGKRIVRKLHHEGAMKLIDRLVLMCNKRSKLHESRSKTVQYAKQVIFSYYIEECDAICEMIAECDKETES